LLLKYAADAVTVAVRLCFAHYQQRESDPIQYVDLDLMQSSGGSTSTMERSVLVGTSTPNKSTEYGEIDWLKTRALASTRKEVETERKFSEKSLDG